jgi:hypothetical protein
VCFKRVFAIVGLAKLMIHMIILCHCQCQVIQVVIGSCLMNLSYTSLVILYAFLHQTSSITFDINIAVCTRVRSVLAWVRRSLKFHSTGSLGPKHHSILQFRKSRSFSHVQVSVLLHLTTWIYYLFPTDGLPIDFIHLL